MSEKAEAFAEWMGFKTCGDQDLENMMLKSREWVHAFRDRQPAIWISFVGPSGTGKTHCGKRLWNWASMQCRWDRCSFIHRPIYWPKFVQTLKAGDAWGERDDIARWPVLFIDDAGAERDPSGFAAEELNTLLGLRMNKWTIFTSNLDMAGLTRLDKRIVSRLYRDGNLCVVNRSKDYSLR